MKNILGSVKRLLRSRRKQASDSESQDSGQEDNLSLDLGPYGLIPSINSSDADWRSLDGPGSGETGLPSENLDSADSADADVPAAEKLRYRILVLGRRNAGKTTLVHKMSKNEGGDMTVIDTGGTVVDAAKPTIERGEHNIGYEITFGEDSQFVFHDSRGIEAGSRSELNKVRRFISKRAKKPKLSDQLHLIWICLSLDTARPLTGEEMRFFDKGSKRVPVIAVFTKFEAFELDVFNQLREDEKLTANEAREIYRERAQEKFKETIRSQLLQTKCPPIFITCVKEMNQPDTQPTELVEYTTRVTETKEILHLFFNSLQDPNRRPIENTEYAGGAVYRRSDHIAVTRWTYSERPTEWFYLMTPPLRGNIRTVKFTLFGRIERPEDTEIQPLQGGPYYRHWSLFDAVIIRQDLRETTACPFIDAVMNRPTEYSYEEQYKGPNYESVQVNGSNKWAIQRDEGGNNRWHCHTVIWQYNDARRVRQILDPQKVQEHSCDFVSGIQSGDRIAIIARVSFPGYTNYVDEVGIEVTYKELQEQREGQVGSEGCHGSP